MVILHLCGQVPEAVRSRRPRQVPGPLIGRGVVTITIEQYPQEITMGIYARAYQQMWRWEVRYEGSVAKGSASSYRKALREVRRARAVMA